MKHPGYSRRRRLNIDVNCLVSRPCRYQAPVSNRMPNRRPKRPNLNRNRKPKRPHVLLQLTITPNPSFDTCLLRHTTPISSKNQRYENRLNDDSKLALPSRVMQHEFSRTCSTYLAPVVQRPDNFIRWIRHYSCSKIYFTLNVVQGFCTLPNLTVARVCIFTCTRGNTEIFAQIETVG